MEEFENTKKGNEPGKSEYLLDVRNLHTHFKLLQYTVKAVNGATFTVRRGKTMGIVGESACGKSVTMLSTMRLIEYPGEIVKGQIFWEGKDLLKNTEKQMKRIRGNEISMIFQEPMKSFNPIFTIGSQLAETTMNHLHISKDEARERAIEYLNKVHIPSPSKRVDDYPFQMSGGMLQRAMIALALSCNPKLLVADEPTTALDVTIQAQIMNLMWELKETTQMSVVLITHDLGLIYGFAEDIMVMYGGRPVEKGTAEQVFKNTLHPYTQDLISAIPALGSHKSDTRLYSIRGNVPDPRNFPHGCKYHPRCRKKFDKCEKYEPPLFEIDTGQKAQCWLYEKEGKLAPEEQYANRAVRKGGRVVCSNCKLEKDISFEDNVCPHCGVFLGSPTEESVEKSTR
jgi:peptide/nickel transport system ATP-binding protein